MRGITLIKKKNNNKDQTDGERLQEFFDFLQGKVPEGIFFTRGHIPKMSSKKAFSVIYYLQEHLPVFPENIKLCWNCKELFSFDEEGLYWELKSRDYCGSCAYLVPVTYDKEEKSKK